MTQFERITSSVEKSELQARSCEQTDKRIGGFGLFVGLYQKEKSTTASLIL